MKPRILLSESTTPDGAPMSLYEHDAAYSISFQGQELMHSKASASQLLLGKLGIELVRKEPDPHFKARMETVGFLIRKNRAKVHAASKRAAYVTYVADK